MFGEKRLAFRAKWTRVNAVRCSRREFFFSARCIRRARADILFSQFFFRPILLQQHTHPFGKDDGDGETDPQQFLSLLSRINNNSQVEEKTHPQIETQAQKDAHEI